MNQKLFFGIICIASIAGIFVACGEGEINSFNADDQVAAISIKSSLDEQKSINACQANPECLEKLSDVPLPTSSAELPPSSSVEPVISSSSISVPPLSSSPIIIASSSSIIIPPSSSTIVITSSSSIITPEGALAGTCSPSPAIAELGQSVTWSFNRDPSISVTQIMAATFDWVFEGASVETFSAKGAIGITKAVSYTTSGPHTTSLSTNGTAPIACTPVQVNGAKITGCKCAVDNASPDVAKGGEAIWTVSGCTSTATITGYTWNGGELGAVETSSHVFTEKDETFAPTLSVSNDDNTVQVVACPAATAIDATQPDYVLDGTAAGTYTLGAGTYSMQYACPTANQYYQPPINISASGGWDAFNVTYSTKTTPAGSSLNSQQHNIEFASLFGSWSGALPTEMVSITVNHPVVIKCQQ